jgi:uridylate kinase
VPLKRRRVLLKLSGEAFGGGTVGVNPDVVAELAKEIAEGSKSAEVAIVVGGGNFFRAEWSAAVQTTWECSELL